MSKNFCIGNHNIGVDRCYIIAEVGSNHDGDKSRAFEMIRLAAQAGANAVKFQLFKADHIAANIDFPETRLEGPFAKFGKNVYDLYKDMELPDSWLKELKACCQEQGVDFLVTPFDEKSADQIMQVGVPALKIASFELTHIPLLKHIGKFKVPILLSTGMADMSEIELALKTIYESGEKRVGLFHCGIDYPAPFESVHLKAMETLHTTFDCPVGYSDHTSGITVPIAAVALGAKLYEKHVTLSDGKSPDHGFALTMEEFAQMVQGMRQCQEALGSAIKDVQDNERQYRLKGRRSIFVVEDVKEGEVFSHKNLAVLRPGNGLSPVRYEEVIGKNAARNIKAPASLMDGDWN
jgi:N,N'-diacetyllegionaminate synthase